MALVEVKEAIGVGKMVFVSCSTDVYEAMQGDWMRNMEVGIPDLLKDGIKVLIYAGEYDLICNWLGKLPASLSGLISWLIRERALADLRVSMRREFKLGSRHGMVRTEGV